MNFVILAVGNQQIEEHKVTTLKTFDACFICFNELRQDARTLNLVRTFLRHGKSVCVIALGNQNDVLHYNTEGITYFFINKSASHKAWRRWFAFLFSARKYASRAKAKMYFAGDLWSLYPGAELKRINGGKLIYDSREIYSELLADKTSPKQTFLTLVEKRLLSKTDEITLSGTLDAEYFSDHISSDHPMKVIMNLPPLREEIKSDKLRKEFRIPERYKILVYQGMVMPGRGLETAVRALVHLPSVVLCILGSGPDREIERLKYLASSTDTTDRVRFCGSVPYDELHEYTSSADIGLCFIEPISFSYRLALPNKLFEYIMARIPVLVSDLPAMKAVAEKYDIGNVLEYSADAEEFARSLDNLMTPERYAECKESCRECAPLFAYESQEHVIMSLADTYT